ncbi:macrophage migration inhibitory factor homolog isoform X1 [Prunus avium]|uniref:L-dopachrome isomerase n=1 Tax=Prunus avium TaxID=42229 RepID=A0A6P5SNQ5_PRUAV|nr:macrophage migration inhibitory factor homolog isoform X1 [Prunus avium]
MQWWPLTFSRTPPKPFLKSLANPSLLSLSLFPLLVIVLLMYLYVMILLNGSVPMAFAGTEEPAAYGELISIGGIGPSVNGKLSSTIAEILETKLSIDSSRFYIKFYDVERPFFGFNGSTF